MEALEYLFWNVKAGRDLRKIIKPKSSFNNEETEPQRQR